MCNQAIIFYFMVSGNKLIMALWCEGLRTILKEFDILVIQGTIFKVRLILFTWWSPEIIEVDLPQKQTERKLFDSIINIWL